MELHVSIHLQILKLLINTIQNFNIKYLNLKLNLKLKQSHANNVRTEKKKSK